MAKTYTSGRCSVTVDDAALILALDRVTEGAASSFTRKTSAFLEGIRAAALPLWPVRSGRSKAGLRVDSKVTPEAIEVRILDDQDYAYKIRFSQWTPAELEALVEAKVRDEGGSNKGYREIVRRRWEQRYYERHGDGAPSEAMAGKGVWATLIRKPAKAGEEALIESLSEDLGRLAKAGA